jgi:glycosyltransferase involved in cell wall biosynthesis
VTAPLNLTVVATHPIQYQIPWFRELAARSEVRLKVLYAHLPEPRQQGAGFGTPFQWDIPMLEGYAWERLPNARRDPDLSSFFGSSTPAVADVLRRERPDAVVLTGWNALPLVQALWAAMRQGIPRVVRGESNALRRRPAAVRAAHRLLLSRFDAFLAIGKANREFYRRYGVPETRLFDCPYFVDNARFASSARSLAPSRDSIRAAWGIPPRAGCFLFAGKLQPKKRILDLLQALRRVPAEAGEKHLLVVGSGEQMEEARALAAGIPVTFAGFLNQTEMPKAYVAADCLVLPSDYGETWGLVVNEAMACGLPAIVSDRVGCAPDLVEDGVTGRIFPFGDVAVLARVIGSLAGSSARLAEMGARARERIAAYSVNAAVTGTLDAVRYVTRSGR